MPDLQCPSCGAPVRLTQSSSVSATCSYCGTTVARNDEQGQNAIKNLGKTSELVEDASPICLGATGEVFGKKFFVLGRLQLVHPTGTWNEWYVSYGGDNTGWLAEALGHYYVTTDGGTDDSVPPFETMLHNMRGNRRPVVKAARTLWQVSEVNRAKCTGGEGELPFEIGQGYELPFADLRGPGTAFATIDFSDSPPVVYVGKCVTWDELHMRNHRTFRGWD